MNARRLAGLALGIIVTLEPLMAGAADFAYYNPPKLKTRGTATTPIAGVGVVVVKVFVTKAGVAKSFALVRSTNHGDDAPALEIAKSSTYAPAAKGSVTQDAFYDYTLKFTSAGLAAGGTATGVAKYKLMISAGNYSGAQAGLKSYIAANPGDATAQLQLGIADEYLNDPTAAVAAFDQAGTIPANSHTVAVRAYNDAAGAAYKGKDYSTAVTDAKKAVALAPGPFTYNTLGTAEDAASQSDAAVTDLEQARKLAATDATVKPADRAHIDGNLISAYLDAGKPDMAKAVLAEATKLDPSNQTAQMFFAQYYVKQANEAQTNAKYTDAAGLFDQAAAAAPAAQAPDLYAQAALALLKVKDNTPNDKAKSEADKALATAPDNALANFAAGIALANQSKSKDALVYLNKADASAKAANNTQLAGSIENIIKQVSGTK